jgi:hypothetical protein
LDQNTVELYLDSYQLTGVLIMADGLGVMPAAKDAKLNDPNQGGNKASPRGGANNGIVEHPQVDKMDHGGIASRAKSAMGEMGHYNVEYYNGGKM